MPTGSQGDVIESDRVPVGDIQPYTEMSGSMADPRATSRPDCPATGRHPAETGLPEAITRRIRRLRLLNSNSTCYLNTVALAWLHATAQIGCSEHVAFGHQIQAWRDVLCSKRAIHMHVLPSWRSILSSWQDVHRQHDAGEMLEHWVAVGRPPVVKGRWEARVETPHTCEALFSYLIAHRCRASRIRYSSQSPAAHTCVAHKPTRSTGACQTTSIAHAPTYAVHTTIASH